MTPEPALRNSRSALLRIRRHRRSGEIRVVEERIAGRGTVPFTPMFDQAGLRADHGRERRQRRLREGRKKYRMRRWRPRPRGIFSLNATSDWRDV